VGSAGLWLTQTRVGTLICGLLISVGITLRESEGFDCKLGMNLLVPPRHFEADRTLLEVTEGVEKLFIHACFFIQLCHLCRSEVSFLRCKLCYLVW